MNAKIYKIPTAFLILMILTVPTIAIFEDISDIDLIKKPFQPLLDKLGSIPVVSNIIDFIMGNWIASFIIFVVIVILFIIKITSIGVGSLSNEEKRLKLQEKYLMREQRIKQASALKRMHEEEKRRIKEEKIRDKDIKQKLMEEKALFGEITKPKSKRSDEMMKQNLKKLGWEDEYIENVLAEKKEELDKKLKGADKMKLIENMCKEDLLDVVEKRSPVNLEKVAKEISVSLNFVSKWATELEKEDKIILKRIKDKTIAIKPELELIQKDIMKQKMFKGYKDKISLTEVLEYIQEKGKASVVNIADKFSIPLTVTKHYLILLERNKLIDIKKRGKGLFAIPKLKREDKLEKILKVKEELKKIKPVKTRALPKKVEPTSISQLYPNLPEAEDGRIAVYLTLAKKLTQSNQEIHISALMMGLEIAYKNLTREQRLDTYADLKNWMSESEFLVKDKMVNGIQNYKLIA